MSRLVVRFLSTLLFSALIFSSYSAAQTAPAASDKLPTFRATTKAVVVDVIAVDGHGQPIPNLKAEDFILLDKGKPQTIRYFDVNFGTAQPPAPSPIQLAPNQFTNLPQDEPGRAINIILVDRVNTSSQDQTYSRQALLQYLNTLPRGQRAALFTMAGNGLQMVQGFTGKSDDLLEAVNTLLTAKSPLYTSEAQKQRDSDRVAYLGRMYGRGSGLSSLVDRLQKSLDAENAHNENIRARVTIASLESLARAVSGYPGRKNLLWLSGDFPFRFGPDITDEYAIEYRQAVQRLSALLASAQIAVYPIDVRGLYSRGVDMSSKAEGPEPNTAVGTLNTTQKFDDRQNKENFRTHSIMSDVARETGGQAYWGSNDLKRAFAKAINGGANYYTLTYTPESIKWDGSYRHLEVKLNRPGAKLVYRRGYYAVPDEEAPGDQVSRLLAAAMQPTTPESTSIIMVVKVSGQGRSDGVVSIDYAIDPRNVSTPPASDGKNSLKLDLMAVAFSEGRDVLQTANRLEGPVGADELKDALNRGIQAHQELKLGPGKYMVRLGVVDRNSTRIGTLDVPIEIPAVQAGK